jgi:hypothetical protein
MIDRYLFSQLSTMKEVVTRDVPSSMYVSHSRDCLVKLTAQS